MHVHVQVMAIRQLSTVLARETPGLAGTRGRVGGAALGVGRGKFALTHVDAARECTGVVLNTVVGDLDVVSPAVHEDTAATLRAIGDGQAVDAGRVAPEVASEAALRGPEGAAWAIAAQVLVAIREQN